MGQLFDRTSRLIRAELNSIEGNCGGNHLNEGAGLVAGGAVAGASIGKVGVLAGGTGYSVGAVPLAALGALTGAALYEALRSILEGDTSSAGAAAIGAAAGAATSATVGGVGVAVGGSAIGVGMASMAAGGAVVALGLVGINRLLQQGMDPEKLLDDAIKQMEADAQKARQALINFIACRKPLQQQYERVQAEVNKWEGRAQLAVQKGNEYLAKEALIRKKMHSGTLRSIQEQLGPEPDTVKNLKRNLSLLEAKIAEAKTLRTSLKAQTAIAKANGQLHGNASRLGSGCAIGVFERMEERVLQMEARSQAAGLAGADLESQFVLLEPDTDVDAELAAMKEQLLGGVRSCQAQLPASASSITSPRDEAFEVKMEELKRQIDLL